MILFHVAAIIVTVLCVLYSDEQGLRWMLGKKEVLNAKKIAVLHVLVSIGLALIILTGGLKAMTALAYYLSNPLFIAKMGFVLVLVVNGFFIGTLSTLATTRSFASLSTKERLPLLASGAASVLGWGGAILLGLLLAFY